MDFFFHSLERKLRRFVCSVGFKMMMMIIMMMRNCFQQKLKIVHQTIPENHYNNNNKKKGIDAHSFTEFSSSNVCRIMAKKNQIKPKNKTNFNPTGFLLSLSLCVCLLHSFFLKKFWIKPVFVWASICFQFEFNFLL